jgi:hypothetical protein
MKMKAVRSKHPKLKSSLRKRGVSPKSRSKSVRFGIVEIHCFTHTLGDCCFVLGGPPVALSNKRVGYKTITVDDFENRERQHDGSPKRLDMFQRRKLLRDKVSCRTMMRIERDNAEELRKYKSTLARIQRVNCVKRACGLPHFSYADGIARDW